MPSLFDSWRNNKPTDDQSVPEPLRGKSQEEILEMVKKAEAATNELSNLKAQLAEREAELAKLSSQQTPPKDQDQPKPLTSFFEDEDKAWAERAAPIMGSVLEVASRTARMIAEQRIRSNPAYGRLLSKYQNDVDKLYATVPPQYQQFPETYERVFKQVLGDHLPELLEEQAKSNGQFFMEPGSGSPPISATNPSEVTLTDDEKLVARKLKIPEEKMLESKKQMQAVGGHISFKRAS